MVSETGRNITRPQQSAEEMALGIAESSSEVEDVGRSAGDRITAVVAAMFDPVTHKMKTSSDLIEFRATDEFLCLSVD